jgi:uncharacterized protein YbbC (DUF1343 family)
MEQGVEVVRLFAPEHGVWGDIEDLAEVSDTREPLTNLPVLSLFGSTLEPSSEHLKDIDALVFDIQDIGSRYYTFNWTMALAMAAASKARCKFVVLDRPNPITGVHVEGNVLDPAFGSFVGLHPVAVRYAMTSGEMAQFVNAEFALGADLTVVPCTNWQRRMWFDETGLDFVPPSPNAPSLEMATLYPGTCLFEGTNLSEGRGTTRPFEVVGAPWIDPFAFASELSSAGLKGVWFRPVYFTPYTSKHSGVRCGGVQVHISDRNLLNAFDVGLYMLYLAKKQSGFMWKNDPKSYAIDLLAGTDTLRLGIDEGLTPDELRHLWQHDLDNFKAKRLRYLIYE